MKYANWNVPEHGAELSEALLRDGCTPLLAAVMQLRGITEPADAREFLRGGEEILSDPFKLPEMGAAVNRIQHAITNSEHVAVYGDYDVDGITSTCLLSDYLRGKGLTCESYIPDRLTEGYGLNNAAIDKLHAMGVSLIITVDCGITNIDEARHAAELGMDMIITDHHESRDDILEQLSDTVIAIVDPKIPYAGTDHSEAALAGVGVAFKLVCAMDGDAHRILERYSDLVAVGTVADVMQLQGENRFITRHGLRKITDKKCRPGFLALAEAAGVHAKPFTASNVSFALAPRINAAGRLSRPLVALRLLEELDFGRARRYADELCQMNMERKDIESNIWGQAEEQVRKEYGAHPDAPLVLAGKNWHQGVIGIVASRLADKYSVPAIMISFDDSDGVGKGSCRSIGTFNLFEALSSSVDCLEGFGGHAMAAGVTVRRENVETLRSRMREFYFAHSDHAAPELKADIRIDRADYLTKEGVESLDLLEPCGNGNPRPLFYMENVMLRTVTPIGGGKHLRLRLEKFGEGYDAVFFGQTAQELDARSGQLCDVIFAPQINDFRNLRTVQLVITDLRRTEER